MKLLYILSAFFISCSTEPESGLEVTPYNNNYIYHGFGGTKKCHEWNNDPNSSFFENPQYSLSSDATCFDYCTDYLNDIQSGWSNYSCYDCSITVPISYRINSVGNIYQDSTFTTELVSAYCQLTMHD